MLEGNALENVKSYKLHGVYVTETFDNAEWIQQTMEGK